MANLRRLLILTAALVLSIVSPAPADMLRGQPDTALTDVGSSLAPDNTAVTVQGQGGVYFFKLKSLTDTKFATRAVTAVTRRVDTMYSDTIALTGENTGQSGSAYTDTTRKISSTDSAAYVLSITNLGNVVDSIGIVIDTVMVSDSFGIDTMPHWTIALFDSRGGLMGNVYTRGRDTFFLRLQPTKSDTIAIRAYVDSGAAETVWIQFTVRTYVGNGNPKQFAMRAYRGFNGETYAGDGHDSITLFASLKAPTKLRVSKTDTVFASTSLGGAAGQFSKTDTQHRIPGATIVYTLWFDNDEDSSTVDTVVIEDWIDTRFARFDSAALKSIGSVGQLRAAESFISNNYGNIFIDSGMPTDTAPAPKYQVTLQYYTSAGLTTLTPSVNPDAVARIRWTIVNRGGDGRVLRSTNGDNVSSIDAAPLGINASTDADMGYVRYAVTIRADSTPSTGPGRPSAGTLVGADPVAAGLDSGFLEPNNSPASRSSLVSGFTAEYLPDVDIVAETQYAKKVQISAGDTFVFAHRIGNHGNKFDSIALTGTTAISGAQVSFFSDIGTVGSYDGFEQKIDTISVKEFDTANILVAVFVPGSYSGSDTVHVRAIASNANFYDTAFDQIQVVGSSQVTPDTAMPDLLINPALGDSLSFTIFLNVPLTEDTVIIQIDTGIVIISPLYDSTTVSLDSASAIHLADSSVKVTFDSVTGILTVTFDTESLKSDSYIWSITILDYDSNSGTADTVYVDTGTFVIDIDDPFAADTKTSSLLTVDTNVSAGDTQVDIRISDTAFGDTNSGIDSVVVIVRDTAGKIISVDTVDAKSDLGLSFDSPGIYTVELIAIDNAGNTVGLSVTDSFAFNIPVLRTILLQAADKNGSIEGDNTAKGLLAQGRVTVTDLAMANKSTVTVTIFSDVDPIGITMDIDVKNAAAGEFFGTFGFTNGTSNAVAKKIRVRDGSTVSATYDADGITGTIALVRDQILWQGVVVKDIDKVRSFPNPANFTVDPYIYIQNLPPDPNMTIEIYSLSGEKLYTLRVGSGITFSAAANLARWDGRNPRGQLVASGTYVYVVKSNVGTKVGKFTLVK